MEILKKQFTSFVVAGVITTALQYAILIILVEFGLFKPVPASIIGALGGALLSYYLNKKFTFQSNANHKSALPKFFTVAAIAIATNTLLMYIFVDLLIFPYILAQIITTGVIIPITFGLNKIWSFANQN